MNFLDLFSGIGGFRLGLERAGHTPVGWVEIDKFARQSYQAIHDTTGEWTAEDITKVTDEEWREFNGKVDIIAGGFPCAPAGTKIKTIDGYKNIEDIKTGDMVLTHNGIYNPVVTPMNKQQNHYNVIKAQGVYGIKLTDEHPVYVYNQKTKETGWVEVKDLTSDMFLSMNINKESSDTDLSEDELWILGLYTADGWLKNDDNHKNVVIGIGEKKLEEFIKRVPSEIISSKRFRKEHNLYEFTLKKDYLYDYAKEIGSGAANKSVPQWIIDLKNDQLEKYLKGYLHGDGHWDNEGKRQMWTTTSEDLALTLQDIFVKLYKVIPSINVRVDDRSKNFKDTYNSQTRYKKRSNQFVVGDKIFTRIKSITRVSQPLTVYNMEVKNDNSYTTNNFIVHNCQAFSIAGKRLGFLDSTKGTLFFDIARAAKQIKPRYLFLENVKGLLNHDSGNTFRTILDTLDELGYDVEWRVLNSKDFGVPQNRERVYIIGHLRGDSGREVFPFFGENRGVNQATVKQVGNISDSNSFGGNPQTGRVYSDHGLSPTLNTMQGGGREPKVLVKEATKKGYDIATVGDNINISQPNSKTRRGRVGHGIANTLVTGSEQATLINEYRIRKLTPLECWRLQAFPDWAFNKAKGAGLSDSQLYKQAGNSVTVNVIEFIAKWFK